MANLILCKENPASMPYYLESASKHIYSMEELYYYIKVNPYLAIWDIMKKEFCIWMKENHIRVSLAQKLEQLLTQKVKPSMFLAEIIQFEEYFTKEETSELLEFSRVMENKSPIECLKLKADHWMKDHKYICAMKEYKNILSSEDKKILPDEQIGNIWNNLGSAYAKLFFFEEAVWCYKKAYSYNNNPKTLNAMEKARTNADNIEKELTDYSKMNTDIINQGLVFLQTDADELQTTFDKQLADWKKEYIEMSDRKDWSIK